MTFFEDAYSGTPPWDIGRPQPALVGAEKAGEIKGSVLDVGCGTGENALFLASRGHPAFGVDGAPTAVRRAKEKARERGLAAEFKVHDALRLGTLKRRFDAVVDSGLFHVFDDDDRPRFVEGLRDALAPHGSYHMVCFSEKEPPGWGPRRVSKPEIEATFGRAFEIHYIKPSRFETNLGQGGVHAYLAWMTRR